MRRLLSPRWLATHAAMLLLVAAFLGLGWWQVSRARAGNTLSIAYAFEWPLFAAFVVGLWAREVRAQLRASRPPDPRATPARPPRAPMRPVVIPVRRATADDDDPALAAYNDYLAWLAADPNRRPADYRREPLQE